MEENNLSKMYNFDKLYKTVEEMMLDRKYNLYNKNTDDNSFEFRNNLNHKTIVLLITKKQDFTPKKIDKYSQYYNIGINDVIIYIICFLEINESLSTKYLNYQNNNTQIFHIKNLLFNITHSKYVPEHIKLDNIQIQELKSQYDINKISKIYITDPICKYFFAKENDIFKIKRHSNNSKYSISYRKCINNNSI